MELQAEFNPDKFVVSGPHMVGQEGYAASYCDQLHQKFPSIKKVLEIGVQRGGSLKLWEKLFDAKVIGVDIDPACAAYGDGINRHVYIGSQTDVEFLTRDVVPHAPFDLIIDDGGHWSNQQIISFNTLWPHLASKGIYLIEDLGTTYVFPNNYGCMQFLKDLVDSIDPQSGAKDLGVESIHFYRGLCWLHKK